ncbi:MAG TPA: hypothetical protein VEK07_25255 [Polyangiaceae bacterium]|nr:hypothetical protein [Polyangiaceae bacterium]
MKPISVILLVVLLALAVASSTAASGTAGSTVTTPMENSAAGAAASARAARTRAGDSAGGKAVPSPASTVVAFENALPASYRLQRVRIWVDGALRYDGPPPMGVPLGRGDHVVVVAADYRMSDPVFSYVRGYQVEVRATRHVPGTDDGRVVVARAIASGGVTTPFDKRARIVWR